MLLVFCNDGRFYRQPVSIVLNFLLQLPACCAEGILTVKGTNCQSNIISLLVSFNASLLLAMTRFDEQSLDRTVVANMRCPLCDTCTFHFPMLFAVSTLTRLIVDAMLSCDNLNYTQRTAPKRNIRRSPDPLDDGTS